MHESSVNNNKLLRCLKLAVENHPDIGDCERRFPQDMRKKYLKKKQNSDFVQLSIIVLENFFYLYYGLDPALWLGLPIVSHLSLTHVGSDFAFSLK